jgi:hypothetical protein
MAERKPWFLVMTQQDANRSGSPPLRAGAASRGKVVVRPVAREGWLVVIAFAATLTAAPLLIWLGLFATGRLSLAAAVAWTVIAAIAIVGGFVLLVQSRMATLPPA